MNRNEFASGERVMRAIRAKQDSKRLTNGMTGRLNPKKDRGGARRFAAAHWAPFLLAMLLAVRACAQLVPDGGTNTLDGVTNTVAGDLTVGTNGSNTGLVLTNGAVLTNTGAAYIGLNAGANSNSVTLAGAGTQWLSTSNLSIGFGGSLNSLVISGGAVVTNQGANTIGFSAGSSFNSVAVVGTGSVWAGQSDLTVGLFGAANSLVVSSGGVVRDVNGVVGADTASSNNFVLMSGPTSVWANRSTLTIGQSGAGNRMTVSNGAVVVNTSGTVGMYAGANGNAVLVTGAGSFWSNSSSVVVGGDSVGNQLLVMDGGRITNTVGVIGNSVGSDSNLVVVSGIGSLWTSSGSLYAGNDGSFNRLEVSNGGSVRADGVIYLGFIKQSSGNSVVAVNGSLTSGSMFVAGFGSPLNTVTLLSNSTWDVRGGNFSLNSLAGQESWTIDATSYVTNIGTLNLDGRDILFSMTNQSEGFLFNRVPKSALKGLPTGFSEVDFANAGTNVQFLISNYTLVDVTGSVGAYAVARSNVVIVAGTNSVWRNTGRFVVGAAGNFNQVIVRDGGTLRDATGDIGSLTYNYGALTPGSSNVVLVTGIGSVWSNSNELRIGGLGGWGGSSGNRLIASNGGAVFSAGGSIGMDRYTHDNFALIVGTGSVWRISGGLTNGYYGVGNQIVVSNGGTLISAGGTIGAYPGANSNRVIVTGENSVWNSSGPVNIGGEPSNQIIISDSGKVFAPSLALSATGSMIQCNGGVLIVTNAAGTGALTLSGGNLILNAGAVVANSLQVGGGRSVTGTGTITGSVANYGTIAPGASLGALTINGSLSLRASANLSFEIGGLLATNQYDVLTVTSFVQLAGTLSLSLLNGFYPAAGDRFTVFNYGSATGAFGNVSGGGRLNTADNLGSFLVTLSATNVVVGGYVSPDSDGDGQSDYAETLAGTNPNDASSALVLVPMSVGAGGAVTLRFPFVAGKSYRLLYSDNLASGVWNVIASPVFTQPSAGLHEWVDDGTQTGGLAGTMRVYRVGLQ
ncbi:MAG: hypothetical protein HY301_18850 [Verrucomicrobia bacterium]|nr:hypothetical protein [Verrucomicrobiota bacterium]